MKLLAVSISFGILSFILGYQFAINRMNEQTSIISSFDECVKAGYPVRETYPPQCVALDGETFVQEVALPSPSDRDGTVVCTMDAFVCPDGSSVGRIPPSCAFAPCLGL